MRCSPLRHLRPALGLVVLGATIVALLSAGAAAGSVARAPVTPTAVIVTADGIGAARRAVAAAGGTVTRRLPLIGGVAARVPLASLPRLRAAAGIRSVERDARLHALSDESCAVTDPACYDELPANTLWEEAIRLDRVPNKWSGEGATVALLDTGVTPSPDLGPRLLARVDLTSDHDGIDRLGHGTHMAGLIAGDGTLSTEGYEGVASETSLVSVKVAGWDGATDVSTVIAGLHWVVAHRDDYGIRVLSLSYGTDARQSVMNDPLNAAIQRVTAAGILVVVSAGNAGAAGSVTKPGDDPGVLTVGSVDVAGTATAADDTRAPFSSYGPTTDGLVKPDVVAPGISIVSLRAPGSTADVLRPAARVGATYFKGTGTSQSTAIVAGVAARMLEADPSLTPARIKGVLMATAQPLAGREGVGAGLVDAEAALRSVAPKTRVAIAPATTALGASTGLGTLDGSRGTGTVLADLDGDGDPEPLDGEVDALGLPWSATRFAGALWDDSSWVASAWAARTAVVAGSATAPSWEGQLVSQLTWEARFWGASSWETAAGWDARFWGARFWGARFWGSATWG